MATLHTTVCWGRDLGALLSVSPFRSAVLDQQFPGTSCWPVARLETGPVRVSLCPTMLCAGTELGILVTFGTWNEAPGQEQLTPLICAKEGWGTLEWSFRMMGVVNPDGRTRFQGLKVARPVVLG